MNLPGRQHPHKWLIKPSFGACVFSPVSCKVGTLVIGRLRKHGVLQEALSTCCHPHTGKAGACRKLQGGQLLAQTARAEELEFAAPGMSKAILHKILAIGAALLLAAEPVLAALPYPQPDSAFHEPFRIGQENLVEAEASVSQGALEDNLANTLRQFEAKVDSAIGFMSNGMPGMSSESKEEVEAASKEGRELVKEVWEVIAKKYVDARGGGFDQARWAQLRDAALSRPLVDKPSTYRAIREMLAQGLSDPYTRFITGESFAAMQSYDITGVGLNLCTSTELEEKTDLRASEPGLYVLGLINRSTASRAGFQQGDQIVAVDGVELRDESPFQAAALIQGPDAGDAKPSVSIKIRKIGSGELRDVKLQRPAKDPSPVTARLVESGSRKIGQIRLDRFVARTQQDVAAAVQNLAAEGAEEFVLDLRNNLGGLVEEGVEVARLFLDGDATIVNRLDSGGLRRKTAAGGNALTHAPVTLLVNEHTASASEILAGALRDNCRAVLVGQRTFGKGLIQGVFQLEDGSALAVTIGKYLTPAKTDIDREGIRPDFGSIPEPTVAAARLAACKIPAVA